MNALRSFDIQWWKHDNSFLNNSIISFVINILLLMYYILSLSICSITVCLDIRIACVNNSFPLLTMAWCVEYTEIIRPSRELPFQCGERTACTQRKECLNVRSAVFPETSYAKHYLEFKCRGFLSGFAFQLTNDFWTLWSFGGWLRMFWKKLEEAVQEFEIRFGRQLC